MTAAHPSVPSDGEIVYADRRQSDAHRHALAVLAAGAHAPVEGEIASRCASRASARRGRCRSAWHPFSGAPSATVLDAVGLVGGEDELAAGDVDLAAAEGDGIDAAFSTERTMSSGSSSPASMKVLVMRGRGRWA